jgi:site-specific DNA recombinase
VEEFAVVGEQMTENRQRHREGKRGATYLLQGLIECVQCGHAFYGKPVTSVYKGKRSYYTYYRCVGCEPYRTGGEKLCSNRQVRTDRLEEAVWQDVIELLSDPKRLEEEAQRRFCQGQGKPESVDRLSQQMQRTKAGLSRVMDAYENGMIERVEFEDRMKRLKQRLAEMENEYEQHKTEEANAAMVNEIVAEWQKFADRGKSGIDQADWLTQRNILRALVKLVKVDSDDIRVIYRIPPQPFAKATEYDSLQDCRDNSHSSQPTK